MPSTGRRPSRWPSLRSWPTACPSASRARTSSGAPSATVTPSGTTSRPASASSPLAGAAAGPRRVRDSQQPAVRGRACRLRVRVQHLRSPAPGDLGGAVRRLRQRRAGADRRVHRVGARQVGPHPVAGAAAAPRLRRSGPGPFERRVERFLQAAAETNIRVAYPSTAGQYFHLLRRQAALLDEDPLPAHRPDAQEPAPQPGGRLDPGGPGRGPLAAGDRRRAGRERPEAIRRLILCSGKVYFDLMAAKQREARPDVAIARLEQLYVFPANEMADAGRALWPRRGCRVGARGAGEHGRVGFRPAEAAGPAWAAAGRCATSAGPERPAHPRVRRHGIVVNQNALIEHAYAMGHGEEG